MIKQFNRCCGGCGGYASGPILRVATQLKLPAVIQEQNSFAGVTNRLVAKRVSKICVAYEKMENYFPAAKIVHTGNPVRKNLIKISSLRDEALKFFGIDGSKKVILLVGGSLGARTLNESVMNSLGEIDGNNVIWQTGKYYYPEMLKRLEGKAHGNLHVFEFLSRMDYALPLLIWLFEGRAEQFQSYVLSKPVVLVPSPTLPKTIRQNAMALVEKSAAVMVTDTEAREKLFSVSFGLLNDSDKLKACRKTLHYKPNAADDIASIVIKLEENDRFSTYKNVYFSWDRGIGMSAGLGLPTMQESVAG